MVENNTNENSVKSKIAEREEKILAFWKERDIFKKSLEKNIKKTFTFYDGPPFANGMPHYGHMLASFIKDAIPRYMTMKGCKVDRRWGWDCHGLPVENEVEKEFGLKTKKDIESFGIEKFNEEARLNVMKYADKWREIIPRIGRWVDMENDYRTMDSSFTESVWWAFSELYKKGLIYQGFKSMHICPRCETTLSNFEVTQGYKEITDISVYVKFKIKPNQKIAGQTILDKDKVFLLAWTTTPWTLPGNTALAVNKDAEYAIVSSKDETYILAKDLEEKVLKDKGVVKTLDNVFIKGEDLVGISYEPPFSYFIEEKTLKNHKNGWKVYSAPFVTMEDGTGIVHIAPAFGDDDLGLANSENLPIVQHVGINGLIKKEVVPFAGLQAKPKEDTQKTDVEVIKYLASKNLLFAKEKIKHQYPHCWRCDTPLLNYATTSWFVKVSEFKGKLVDQNKKINWVPNDIKEGRFGKWLEGAKDWAISRSRFWGAPIPVWICNKCDEKKVVGSVKDILKKSENKYFLIRHGEAENNILSVNSSKIDSPHKLTEKGKKQIRDSAENLKKNKIDLIFYSPLRRTHQSAEILRDCLGVNDESCIPDDRLRETGYGEWEGKKSSEYRKFFPENSAERFDVKKNGIETYNEIKKRVGGLVYDLEKKYKNKNILIVSHDTPIWMLHSLSLGLGEKETLSIRGEEEDFSTNAQIFDLDYKILPRNKSFDLDLHRPFIDDVNFQCHCGGKMQRVPEVFDCWFESGSMPFASNHYPYGDIKKFDPRGNLLKKPVGYPAQFIAEGLDQTRGWFYSMLVLGTALFGKTPYESVIVNGTVLAESGEKMSKRLKNYPDPMYVVEKYGADSLRYYLLSSPVVHAEDLKFSEKGVDEVSKKILSRLDNVLSFYKLYERESDHNNANIKSNNVLDLWLIARLLETIKNIGDSLEKYELDRASRPVLSFIEDLSVWYLRRSRDRFKSDDHKDKTSALNTTRFVLLNFSKALAPFLPFYAEYLYQELKGEMESVHLENWPRINLKIQEDIIEKMAEVRKITSMALEKRAKANIKVRQPLLKLKINLPESRKKLKIGEEFLSIVKDEVNVKEVVFDSKLNEEVELDINITAELKEEGMIRDIVRAIQEARKNKNLTIKDKMIISVDCNESVSMILEKNREKIAKLTLASEIKLEKLDDVTVMETDIGPMKVSFSKV